VTDDHVIDIRQYLAQKAGASFPRVFSVWGGEGGHSRFALPVWRAVNLLGGDWGGIVSLPSIEAGAEPCPLFVVDLKEEPARTMSPLSPLPGLRARKAPSVAVGAESGLAVLLGEGDGRQWFLRILGGRSGILPEGKARETLLFLAGECSGLLFHRELATPLPSSSSAP
jgi:hypothetical protein